MADRLVCGETVAYKATDENANQRGLMIVAVRVLGIVLLDDPYEHLADREAYEAEGLPQTPKKGRRGDDGARADNDCLNARNHVTHDDGRC